MTILPAEKTLPRLSYSSIEDRTAAQDRALPERVLQFGEGNFLRAFVDWMLCEMNAQGQFNGRAVVVQPIDRGLGALLNEQDGLYTTVLRGIDKGEVTERRQLVTTVSRALNPYAECDAWLETARGPDFRFVVSNTTEAGIALDPEDSLDARPSPSYPGKLTQWLYARYIHFEGAADKGVIVLPCELIERNGQELERLVFQLADEWKLPSDFRRWLGESCTFTSTLVDRIVTGYPKAESEEICAQLGYEDRLLVAGEIYHCWVIESSEPLESELPLKKCGLNVVWTTDALPYRERKVRILNGAHTAMTVVGLLAGLDTVGACMKDSAMRKFVQSLLAEEVTPLLDGDAAEIQSFADAVIERFENPFVRHELSSIALNSVSKYRARLLGSFRDYTASKGSLPRRLVLALASLLVLYRPSAGEVSDSGVSLRPQDEPRVIEFLQGAWERHDEISALVDEALGAEVLFGEDLRKLHPELTSAVAREVENILAGELRARVAALG